MADEKRVELVLGIKTVGAVDASQGLESISNAADNLRGELSKFERADVLLQLGQTAAVVAQETGDATAAVKRLADELFYAGASEAEIRKVSKAFDDTTKSIEKAQAAEIALRAKQEKQGAAMAADIEKSIAASERLGEQQAIAAQQTREAASGASTLQKELGAISRTAQINQIATEMGTLARETEDTAGAVAQLDEKLKAIGADKGEIQAAAQAFEGARTAPDVTGGGSRLTAIGTGLRNLPSLPIPGLNISTDQVANLIRLGGAIENTVKAAKAAAVAQQVANAATVASETASTGAAAAEGAQTVATTGVAVSSGAAAGGLFALLAPLAPIAAIAVVVAAGVAAVAAVLGELNRQSQEAADGIRRRYDAQKKVDDLVAEGTTTNEALEQRAKLEQEIKAATDRSNQAQAEKAATFAADAKATSDFQARLRGNNAVYKEFDEIAKENSDNARDLQADLDALNSSLEDGAFAANDAAAAEKKLAEERSKDALQAADVAGRELASQQKALNATEQQNRDRLDAIEDEKAVIQKQIDTLNESGVTSEEVTAKLEALNTQLGSLGKESEFIKNTALEVSRANDAAKQAEKDRKDAEKKAQQAQEQYTKSIESAQKQFTQSTQDIQTKFRQTTSDNQLKFNRDITDLTTKYHRDQFDLEVKAQRAERDAAVEQAKDLQKIQKDADKNEQQAIQDGDFKALFLARQSRKEAILQEQDTLDESKQKREQDAKDARDDLLRNAQRTRQDRMLTYERQITDSRTAQTRELAQAQLARQRNLQAASEALNAELGIRQQFWNATVKQAQNALNQINGMQAASGQGSTRTPLSEGFSFKAMKGVLRK